MLIRAGYEIRYECDVATPMLAMLSVHPSRSKDFATPHRIAATPDVPMYDYLDGFGNICTRITMPAGGLTLSNNFAIRDDGAPDPVARHAAQHAVEDLPDDVLVYLLSSRYCETERLAEMAWSLFGNGPTGWDRVQRIVDFTNHHIEFGYQHARPTKTAWEAYQERQGVCRDFAHLAITLCRCVNIPARYCTGYLGDIGISPTDGPMDFSAWFEAYLGGAWHIFDARHNQPRIGRILMARGRDATDAAMITTFGFAQLASFKVHTFKVAP